MSSGIRGAAGDRPAVSPLSALAWVLIALCAVLLVKWLAVATLVALVLYGLVRWAVRARRGARLELDAPAADPAVGRPSNGGEGDGLGGWFSGRASAGADCSWCGRAGGHHDTRGRPVRPRYAHILR